MAYVAGDIGITLIGTALSGSEVFNMTYAISGAAADATLATSTFMSDLSAVMSTEYRFDAVRFVILNTDTVIDLPLDDPILGQDSSGPLPPQCAMRVSLKTTVPGRSGRGGFFIPGLCKGSIDTTSARFGTGTISTVVDAVTDYSNALNALGQFLSINSRTLGQVDPCNSARIGNVVDTIRRRRDALVEVWTPVPL